MTPPSGQGLQHVPPSHHKGAGYNNYDKEEDTWSLQRTDFDPGLEGDRGPGEDGGLGGTNTSQGPSRMAKSLSLALHQAVQSAAHPSLGYRTSASEASRLLDPPSHRPIGRGLEGRGGIGGTSLRSSRAGATPIRIVASPVSPSLPPPPSSFPPLSSLQPPVNISQSTNGSVSSFWQSFVHGVDRFNSPPPPPPMQPKSLNATTDGDHGDDGDASTGREEGFIARIKRHPLISYMVSPSARTTVQSPASSPPAIQQKSVSVVSAGAATSDNQVQEIKSYYASGWKKEEVLQRQRESTSAQPIASQPHLHLHLQQAEQKNMVSSTINWKEEGEEISKGAEVGKGAGKHSRWRMQTPSEDSKRHSNDSNSSPLSFESPTSVGLVSPPSDGKGGNKLAKGRDSNVAMERNRGKWQRRSTMQRTFLKEIEEDD